MTSGNVITSTGAAVLLDRGFLASPTYASPTIFMVGEGTNTPGLGDVMLQSPIHRGVYGTTDGMGTPTSTGAFLIKDTAALFQTWGCATGDIFRLYNATTTLSTYTTVASVDSEIQMTLNADIVDQVAFRSYDVYFTKALVATYPLFDTGSNIATSRALLLTTECNGAPLTEFGLFNVDVTGPKLICRAVFPLINKTSLIQIIFVEKDTG